MPKRILDGEGLWRSDKLAKVEPSSRRAEYATLLPLALSNGVFECNPRRIWATVYSYNRPDVTLEDVEQILAEFERVKLLFRWTEGDGKVWGYWVGIEKPGRLPGVSRRGKNESAGPNPPMDSMRKFLESTNGIHAEAIEQPNGTDLCLGLGLGFGSGLGSGTDSIGIPPKKGADPSKFTSLEVAIALCTQQGWSGVKVRDALESAITFQAKLMPEAELGDVGEWLIRSYRDSRSKLIPQIFFSQGMYRHSSPPPKSNGSTFNPATAALAQLEE